MQWPVGSALSICRIMSAASLHREHWAVRLLFDVFFFIEWSAVVFGLLAGALAVGCGLLLVEDEEPLQGAGRDASKEDGRDDSEGEFHKVLCWPLPDPKRSGKFEHPAHGVCFPCFDGDCVAAFHADSIPLAIGVERPSFGLECFLGDPAQEFCPELSP